MKPPTAVILTTIAIMLYVLSRPAKNQEPMPKVYSNEVWLIKSNWVEIATNRSPLFDFHGTPAPE